MQDTGFSEVLGWQGSHVGLPRGDTALPVSADDAEMRAWLSIYWSSMACPAACNPPASVGISWRKSWPGRPRLHPLVLWMRAMLGEGRYGGSRRQLYDGLVCVIAGSDRGDGPLLTALDAWYHRARRKIAFSLRRCHHREQGLLPIPEESAGGRGHWAPSPPQTPVSNGHPDGNQALHSLITVVNTLEDDAALALVREAFDAITVDDLRWKNLGSRRELLHGAIRALDKDTKAVVELKQYHVDRYGHECPHPDRYHHETCLRHLCSLFNAWCEQFSHRRDSTMESIRRYFRLFTGPVFGSSDVAPVQA